MDDHETPSWVEATRLQYDDDTNLAARQALFAHLTDATPLVAPMDDLGVLVGQAVLDIGCGNGAFLGPAHAAGARVVGVDFSHGMASAARDATAAPVANGDAMALPFPDDTFDTVLALWMLYHVPSIVGAVRELRRVLRPGGRLVVTTNSGTRSMIDEVVESALADVLGHPVTSWHAPLPFTAENGAALVAEVFDDVETHPFGTTYHVTDADTLVRYAGSMLGPIEEQHGAFDQVQLLEAVGHRADVAIAAEGAVHIERAGAVFLAS